MSMTEQEAIEVIKKADEQSIVAIEKLKAIEDDVIRRNEYGEYYAILENCLKEREACALAIKALQKQVPMKVEIVPWNPAYCPSCGENLSKLVGDGFYKHTFLERCPNVDCSQRLKW